MDNTTATAIGASGPDASLEISALGQTMFALMVVLGIILALFYLVRWFTNGASHSRKHLTVISSSMVGAKERVVIVDVEGTWLVLGVGNGNVNKLHELPSPDHLGIRASNKGLVDDSHQGGFGERFKQALMKNLKR